MQEQCCRLLRWLRDRQRLDVYNIKIFPVLGFSWLHSLGGTFAFFLRFVYLGLLNSHGLQTTAEDVVVEELHFEEKKTSEYIFYIILSFWTLGERYFSPGTTPFTVKTNYTVGNIKVSATLHEGASSRRSFIFELFGSTCMCSLFINSSL